MLEMTCTFSCMYAKHKCSINNTALLDWNNTTQHLRMQLGDDCWHATHSHACMHPALTALHHSLLLPMLIHPGAWVCEGLGGTHQDPAYYWKDIDSSGETHYYRAFSIASELRQQDRLVPVYSDEYTGPCMCHCSAAARHHQVRHTAITCDSVDDAMQQ